MSVLLIGTIAEAREWELKFGVATTAVVRHSWQEALPDLSQAEVIFDYTHDVVSYPWDSLRGKVVFANCAFRSLGDMLAPVSEQERDAITFYGFCGLPSFVNRPCFEVSCFDAGTADKLKDICQALQTDFVVVADQAGLITARVICMIINEAYYTLEEGTASREDIDLAMKLGTNYPYGPFEWGELIGVKNVKRVVEIVLSGC